MLTAKDIVSSIFRYHKGEDLSPKMIRDENTRLCSRLGIPEFGDPGRVAREFAELGFVQKDVNKKFRYDPELLSEEDAEVFESYEYVYDSADSDENSEDFVHNFCQYIYYGVPGSGKSHNIDEIIKDYSEHQKMRVVFHPDYTNADFIGQVLPKLEEGNVKYEFRPGPFTKILYRAYHHPSEKYFLVIEEINRGNAAAIFGDVFQLLDRIKDGEPPETLEGNVYGTGWSKYFIENDFVNNYLRSPIEYNQDGFTEKHEEINMSFGNTITFTPNTGIRLPPNLSLYATMNTSDQNVFTLDNAFQRRWDMLLVKNECNDSNQMDAKITVNGQTIIWKDFQQTINAVIGEKSNEGGLSSMEDKRLGCWFVKAENKMISKEVFANKVLKYLWDDAFKFCHQEIFGDVKNFEDLQKSFLENGFDIFSDECNLRDKIQAVESPDSEESLE